MYAESLTYRSASEVNTAMAGVYRNMSVAVLVSMLVSWFVGTSPELMQFFFGGWQRWLVVFAPLVFIFLVPILINSGISKTGALGVLWAFAALMGLSSATIFVVFQLGSIFTAFMGAAVLFGVMSFYGYFTKRDLTSVGQFMFIGLIAIIIASIINIFVGSSIVQMVISALAIIIFTGLTAYDTQQIREMVSVDTDGKAEVTGALTLYLDFINIFLNLLQLIGDRKE